MEATPRDTAPVGRSAVVPVGASHLAWEDGLPTGLRFLAPPARAAAWVLLSAAAYAASFHAGCALLAWVALVPLLLTATRLGPGWAAIAGLAWGIVDAYGVGWWFPGMLAGFFGSLAIGGGAGILVVGLLQRRLVS